MAARHRPFSEILAPHRPPPSLFTAAATVRDVYRFLLTWRWLRLAALVVVLAVCFLFLARWQWHRLESKRAENALVTQNIHRAPVPVTQVLAPGHPLSAANQWRMVQVRGRYDTAHEIALRSRVQNGTVGFDVLTPVRLADGTGILVDRGWVPATGPATEYPSVPRPPSGEVTVTGRARPGHIARERSVPASRIMSKVDVGVIAAWTGYPVADGYVELTGQQPPSDPAPAPVPLPELSEGPHLAYAIQWVLFALLALGGFVGLARQEARGKGWPGSGRPLAGPPEEPGQRPDDASPGAPAPAAGTVPPPRSSPPE